jgi:arylformamidase
MLIADPIERERAYSPSSCIGGDWRPYLHQYAQRSQQAHQRCLHAGATWSSLAYGGGSRQRIELCVPTQGRSAARRRATPSSGMPLLVYIHGGYWQDLSARDSRFAAAACIEQGMAFAAVGYTLAPSASVATIVGECRAALKTLQGQAAALGIDAARIVLAGSSAGAHLAAMVMATAPAASNASAVPANPAIRLGVLLSGIYDLQPLVGTSINGALSLTLATARAASPLWVPLPRLAPAIVAWGAIETDAFKQQSSDWAACLVQAGVPCRAMEIAHRNHFDVVFELSQPASRLWQAIRDSV